MAGEPTHYRPRDHNVMFAIHYEDGRTAYMTVSPKLLDWGDQAVPAIARERQEKGELPDGQIKGVKREHGSHLGETSRGAGPATRTGHWEDRIA